MRLTPMRYKDYIWPSNPGSYRISFRRVVAEHKLPFGRSVTQDLGQVCRVLEGEGEFAGEGAYEEFKRLATVFYGGGAGVLVHPVWMTTRAYFTELEVVQEPLPDYVRYRFAFCEAGSEGAALKEVSTSAPGGYAWRPKNGERVLVIKGGTLGEERYVAGSLDAAREQDDLDDGEVRIYAESGGASITLRRNGHVEIEGDLFINGAMYVPPVS